MEQRIASSKWSDDKIAEVRKRVAQGELQKCIRIDFGMSQGYVSEIVNNKHRVT
jgi:hypothetical protein